MGLIGRTGLFNPPGKFLIASISTASPCSGCVSFLSLSYSSFISFASGEFVVPSATEAGATNSSPIKPKPVRPPTPSPPAGNNPFTAPNVLPGNINAVFIAACP